MPPSWQSLVELMRAAPEDCRTLARCSELLLKVSPAELADGAEAVVAVVAALRYLVKSGSRSLHAAVYALAVLANASAANRQAAASAGALDAVVTAMRVAAGDAELQAHGCTAFSQLVKDGYALRAEAAAEAALGAVVAAYYAHPDDALVVSESQEATCCIILEGATYKVAAGKAGAIEVVISQIRAHMRDENDNMLLRCFFLLGNLYDLRERCDRRLMLAVECIQLVVTAMVARFGVARVQWQGCFVLASLASHAPDHEMMRTGGLSAAVKALLQYESEWRVQNNACSVLEWACRNRPDSSDTAVFAVGLGAVGGAIAALRAHPGNEEVQRAASGALCWITVSLKNEQMHSAGMAAAIEPLVAALCAYPANPILQRHTCVALSSITRKRFDLADRAVEAGAIEAILAGMVAISDAASLAVNVQSSSPYQAACLALEALLNLNMAAEQRAVCAVAAIEDVVVATRGLQSDYPSDVRVCATVLQQLHAAARWHDRSRCSNAGCKRCAAARERGVLCALPGCGARLQQNRKKLKRCGRCLVAAYCGEAHQRDHWPTHRPLCDPAARAADADASAGAADASSAMERLSI